MYKKKISINEVEKELVWEVRLDALRAEIEANGYMFTVGHNPACAYTIEELCTLKPEMAVFAEIEDPEPEIGGSTLALPPSTTGCCSGVNDQGYCGSCWAFASVAAIECAIDCQEGPTSDFSEQQVLLTGYRKMYAYKKKIRIVYRFHEGKLLIFIVAVGKREDMSVFQSAFERIIKENSDRQKGNQ